MKRPTEILVGLKEEIVNPMTTMSVGMVWCDKCGGWRELNELRAIDKAIVCEGTPTCWHAPWWLLKRRSGSE